MRKGAAVVPVAAGEFRGDRAVAGAEGAKVTGAEIGKAAEYMTSSVYGFFGGGTQKKSEQVSPAFSEMPQGGPAAVAFPLSLRSGPPDFFR